LAIEALEISFEITGVESIQLLLPGLRDNFIYVFSIHHFAMRYLKLSPTEYFLRLEEGDDVILSLRDFARKETILSAIFNGLGSLERASLAFYNIHEKKFDFRDYTEELEMQNLIGNISIDGRRE